jgi:hypothetical protein
MVVEAEIRNWMRLAFREGKKEEIPAHILAILEAEAAQHSVEKKEQKKGKEE